MENDERDVDLLTFTRIAAATANVVQWLQIRAVEDRHGDGGKSGGDAKDQQDDEQRRVHRSGPQLVGEINAGAGSNRNEREERNDLSVRAIADAVNQRPKEDDCEMTVEYREHESHRSAHMRDDDDCKDRRQKAECENDSDAGRQVVARRARLKPFACLSV